MVIKHPAEEMLQGRDFDVVHASCLQHRTYQCGSSRRSSSAPPTKAPTGPSMLALVDLNISMNARQTFAMALKGSLADSHLEAILILDYSAGIRTRWQ